MPEIMRGLPNDKEAKVIRFQAVLESEMLVVQIEGADASIVIVNPGKRSEKKPYFYYQDSRGLGNKVTTTIERRDDVS